MGTDPKLSTQTTTISHLLPFLPRETASREPQILYQLSQMFSLLTGAYPGECYANALSCLELVRLPALRYCEGWIVWEQEEMVEVIEHAWLQWREAGILDLSLIWLTDEPSARKIQFFAALQYSFAQLQDLSPAGLPTVRNHANRSPTTGLEHPLYQAAYQKAISSAHARAVRTEPPKDLLILPASLSGEREDYVPLRLTGSGLRPVGVPDKKKEYVLALSPAPALLYQCPSRRLAGQLCHRLRQQHKRAALQFYQGNWVVITEQTNLDLIQMAPLLARFGATQMMVSLQVVSLLLSGIKRPRQEPVCFQEQEHPACLMGSRHRRRHKQHWFSPFLKKP